MNLVTSSLQWLIPSANLDMEDEALILTKTLGNWVDELSPNRTPATSKVQKQSHLELSLIFEGQVRGIGSRQNFSRHQIY